MLKNAANVASAPNGQQTGPKPCGAAGVAPGTGPAATNGKAPAGPGAEAIPIEELLRRARAGDRSVLPELRKQLDENPANWRDLRQLAKIAEQSWINQISGTDLLLAECVVRQVEKLKRDLGGDSPTPLENILIERITACWLSVQHAELAEASAVHDGGQVSQIRIKRLDAANKRFLAATRALAVTRRLTAGLKIEITHQQEPAAPTQRPVATATRDVHGRLRDFIDESVAQDQGVMSGAGV